MLKLEIKFNEAKMQADHKYAPEAIYAALDKAFDKYHFRKETLTDGTMPTVRVLRNGSERSQAV